MYVRQLVVTDFRSYATAQLDLGPGVTTLVGLNGQGKTNLVAIGYAASLSSHRVATDQPLVRFGAERATIRRSSSGTAGTRRSTSSSTGPGQPPTSTARRSRVRATSSARCGPSSCPEDLALVRATRPSGAASSTTSSLPGNPAGPGCAASTTRSSSSATPCSSRGRRCSGRGPRSPAPPGDPDADEARESVLHTLHVWDTHLAAVGSQLLYARLRLTRDLTPT